MGGARRSLVARGHGRPCASSGLRTPGRRGRTERSANEMDLLNRLLEALPDRELCLLTRVLLFALNGFLALVALAVLFGVWIGRIGRT